MRGGMAQSALVRGAVVATVAFTLAGCGLEGQGGGDQAAGTGQSAASALKDLKKLEVKGRAPMTGFDRDEFGPAWTDVDHNGCDTRNDILKRDLKDETFKQGTHDCIVLTGVLDDPYSGKTISFTRGQKTSTAVQIDHVVALADAWQKGAQQLPESRRKELANDPLNLLATDGPLNGQKGAGDAATWLPPRRAYRCTYVSRQIEVKVKYDLWVTSAEKDAMQTVLDSC
ncbi:HNH endonuclease family protein [Streptosporangium sp. NBC_01756]|uniref:HNH endonuclease family protein n=1 Tax=Streptosporangium sp. NBC_01756 TaxID=2975950 RepID=UPI002DD9B5DE|nr:HNH endonuclease family protein [Streptosporangium sp. NBC_01756]WSC84480.1 HNH endonuclease family protein [Streptosporangium sp. NBC_01756]